MSDTANYKKLLEGTHDGIYLVDRNRCITYWNQSAERITGFSAEEVMGRPCSDNILVHIDKYGRSLCLGQCPLADTILDGCTRDAEVFLHHKTGHRVPVSVRVSPLIDEEGVIVGGMEIFSEIVPKVHHGAKLMAMDRHELLDDLTHLPSRPYLESEITSDLLDLTHHDCGFGVLLLSVDDMEQHALQIGPDGSDRLFCAAANTLGARMRPFDTFGRWGQEEFVGVILVSTLKGLTAIAEEMRVLLAHTYIDIEDRKVAATCSFGGTLALLSDTVDSLVDRAAFYMEQCQERGGNRIWVATDDDTLKNPPG